MPENLSSHQPEPTSMDNDKYPFLWDLVRQDMVDRENYGHKKYGMRSQPFNGRDALIDAYQEALDLVLYLRQAIYERDNSKETDEPKRQAPTSAL